MNNNSTEHIVDITKASNSLWLVKVPNYIGTKWDQLSSGEKIGSLKLTRRPNEKVQMSLILSKEISTDGSHGGNTLPKEYKLNVEAIKEQSMIAFSEQTSITEQTEKLKITGFLSQKVNIMPTAEDSYMNLKMDTIRQAYVPKRTSMQLDNVVKSFKPIADHVVNIENRKNKKTKIRKYKSNEEITTILFEAFSKKRYYNIRDLVKMTAEPISSLKSVLKEICDYNVKNPFRNMWELKPEYRHYAADK